jgi:hypothetical protein
MVNTKFKSNDRLGNNELQRKWEAESRPNSIHLPGGSEEEHIKPQDGKLLCLKPGIFEYEAETPTTRTLNAEKSQVH